MEIQTVEGAVTYVGAPYPLASGQEKREAIISGFDSMTGFEECYPVTMFCQPGQEGPLRQGMAGRFQLKYQGRKFTGRDGQPRVFACFQVMGFAPREAPAPDPQPAPQAQAQAAIPQAPAQAPQAAMLQFAQLAQQGAKRPF